MNHIGQKLNWIQWDSRLFDWKCCHRHYHWISLDNLFCILYIFILGHDILCILVGTCSLLPWILQAIFVKPLLWWTQTNWSWVTFQYKDFELPIQKITRPSSRRNGNHYACKIGLYIETDPRIINCNGYTIFLSYFFKVIIKYWACPSEFGRFETSWRSCSVTRITFVFLLPPITGRLQ